MSERHERKDWESFRHDWGRFTCYFKQRWEQLKGEPPSAAAIYSYQDKRRELTAPLGVIQHDDFQHVEDIPPGFEAELDRIAREEDADELVATASLFDEPEAEAPMPKVKPAPAEPPPLTVPIVTITKRYEWEMGHRLPLHDGKCNRLHGHHYVAEVDVSGTLQIEGPGTGMVIDFYIVKQALERTIGYWDHRTMLHIDDPLLKWWSADDTSWGLIRTMFMPTAENIAREALTQLRAYGLNVTRVRVYETPDGWAEVRP